MATINNFFWYIDNKDYIGKIIIENNVIFHLIIEDYHKNINIVIRKEGKDFTFLSLEKKIQSCSNFIDP